MGEFTGSVIEDDLFEVVQDDVVVQDPTAAPSGDVEIYDISQDPYIYTGDDTGELSVGAESYYPSYSLSEDNASYDYATFLLTDNEPVLEIADDTYVSMDPVVIDDTDQLIAEETNSDNVTEFDDKNILKSLASVRDAVKLGNTLETDYNTEVLQKLEAINDNLIYSNYLVAVTIGVIVIKTIFDKVMP